VDGSGSLEIDELRVLVKRLLPSVSEKELRYFQAMIATENTSGVTQKQFLVAARECLETEKRVRSRDPDVMSVIERVQQHMRLHLPASSALFMSLDNSRTGET
jgi:hypothetical protein